MRTLFLFLLGACLLVFAWSRGLLGALPEPGREPERIARQVAPERIQLLQTPPAPAPAAPACLAFGPLAGADLKRAAEAFAGLALGERQSEQAVELPGWFMVYLPPLASRELAEQRAAALRAQGMTDVKVIGEGSPLRNALVLGSFRDEAAAREHAAALEKRGVKGLRVPERAPPQAATRFEFRGLDATSLTRVQEIARDFPGQPLAPCAP
jgi:hypothetical protein